MSDTYNEIITLEGLEAVRKRPGMYIGSISREEGHTNPPGLIQIAREIIANSTDEAMNGFGDKVIVTVHKDNAMTVQDFGCGVPMGKDYDHVIRSFTVMQFFWKVLLMKTTKPPVAYTVLVQKLPTQYLSTVKYP